MIRILEAFNEINPLIDPIPLDEHDDCHYIVQEAKKILNPELTIKELNSCLEYLSQLRLNEIVSLFKLESLNKQEPLYLSAPSSMYRALDHVELPAEEKGSLAINMSDVFAAGALACVCDFVACQNKQINKAVSADEFDRLINASIQATDIELSKGLPVEAMEFVGYARQLKWIEAKDTEREIREAKRGESVRKTKLKTYKPIKQEVIAQYNYMRAQKPGLSNRAAAKSIHDSLSAEIKHILVGEDKINQIAIWIGQYRKGRLADIESFPPYTE